MTHFSKKKIRAKFQEQIPDDGDRKLPDDRNIPRKILLQKQYKNYYQLFFGGWVIGQIQETHDPFRERLNNKSRVIMRTLTSL